jgi:hypothetical protein
MKKHFGLRIALFAVIAIGAGIAIAGEALPRIGADRRIALLLTSAFFLPWIVQAVLAGVLAGKLNRNSAGWVIGSIFLPFIVPFFLVFMKGKEPAMKSRPPVSAAIATDPEFKGFNEQGFCWRCVGETSEEAPGNVSSFNGIGTALMGTRWTTRGLDPCPACGSVVQSKWRTFGFGISKIGTYRIIYTKRGFTSSRFFGRRLLSDYAAIPAPESGA